MSILPRPGHTWAEWDERSRNHWLQIHIAREPGFCTQKTFQALPFPYGKEERPGYWSIKRFGCPTCGYIMGVSLDNLRQVPREHLFPPRHPFPIPRYTQDSAAIRRLVHLVEDRGPKDSLFRAWYQVLGGDLNALDCGENAIKTLIGMELMGYAPPKIGEHLYQAYQQRAKEDLQAYNDDAQLNLLDRLFFIRSEQDIPLFARIGPPQKEYTRHDLPYLLYLPAVSGIWDHWAEVLVEKRTFHEFYPLPSLFVAQYGEELKKHFRGVDGPLRYIAHGMRCYWSYCVDLFS